MQQHEALDILKLGRNVFLTGAPGSGKTYLVNRYIDELKKRGASVGITASTGIAATHIGGRTIHSWAGFGIRDYLTQEDVQAIAKKPYIKKQIRKTDVLVIDEASMLHANQLDMVDAITRALKDPFQPFGGIQVILSGDLFQLPPVKAQHPEEFVHNAPSWEDANIHVCYLTEQHRQSDSRLLNVLQSIRENTVTEETVSILRERFDEKPTTSVTKLYTHNADVDRINHAELSKLEGRTRTYRMSLNGNKHLAKTIAKNCLAPEELQLKEGAAVMFVKNNFDAGYVNGTLGTVVGFDRLTNLPIVEKSDGGTVVAKPAKWAVEEDGREKASINQIPLRLAWAITVHKSQGLTMDAAEIDLSKSFAPGMGYVALSRLRSLGGLYLRGLNDHALRVDPHINEHNNILLERSQKTREHLARTSTEELESKQEEFLGAIGGKKKKQSTTEKTKALLQKKYSIQQIAEQRGLTPGTVITHIEKMVEKETAPDLSHIKPDPQRLANIHAAFWRTGDTKLTPVKNLLGDGTSYAELRIARLFLENDN